MTFKESLEKLGIPEFEQRIFNSNSKGELFHLSDYVLMAETLPNTPEVPLKIWFPVWFNEVVKGAICKPPDAILQHIPKILREHLGVIKIYQEKQRESENFGFSQN